MPVTIRTTVLEYGLHRDEYDAMVNALRAEGLYARMDQPLEEKRFDLETAAAAVGIWIANEAAGDVAVEMIKRAAAATIGKRLKGRRRQPVRRLQIYGPNGDVLTWVDLPDDSDR